MPSDWRHGNSRKKQKHEEEEAFTAHRLGCGARWHWPRQPTLLSRTVRPQAWIEQQASLDLSHHGAHLVRQHSVGWPALGQDVLQSFGVLLLGGEPGRILQIAAEQTKQLASARLRARVFAPPPLTPSSRNT